MKDNRSSPPAGAIVSTCGTYRYLLTRPPLPDQERIEKPPLLFVIHSPYTDGQDDDAITRSCRYIGARERSDGITIVSLYARISEGTKALYEDDRACIGPDNDDTLAQAFHDHATAVCAWGNSGDQNRVKFVIDMMLQHNRTPLCLGVTGHGMPKSPRFLFNQAAISEYRLGLM